MASFGTFFSTIISAVLLLLVVIIHNQIRVTNPLKTISDVIWNDDFFDSPSPADTWTVEGGNFKAEGTFYDYHGMYNQPNLKTWMDIQLTHYCNASFTFRTMYACSIENSDGFYFIVDDGSDGNLTDFAGNLEKHMTRGSTTATDSEVMADGTCCASELVKSCGTAFTFQDWRFDGVVLAPYTPFRVTLRSDVSGDNPTEVGAWVDFRITCNQIPTAAPTMLPTPVTAFPSVQPTFFPTAPTTKTPSAVPTSYPSTGAPSRPPSVDPTALPSYAPSVQPTQVPSRLPSSVPTLEPTTRTPTRAPTGKQYPLTQVSLVLSHPREYFFANFFVVLGVVGGALCLCCCLSWMVILLDQYHFQRHSAKEKQQNSNAGGHLSMANHIEMQSRGSDWEQQAYADARDPVEAGEEVNITTIPVITNVKSASSAAGGGPGGTEEPLKRRDTADIIAEARNYEDSDSSESLDRKMGRPPKDDKPGPSPPIMAMKGDINSTLSFHPQAHQQQSGANVGFTSKNMNQYIARDSNSWSNDNRNKQRNPNNKSGIVLLSPEQVQNSFNVSQEMSGRGGVGGIQPLKKKKRKKKNKRSKSKRMSLQPKSSTVRLKHASKSMHSSQFPENINDAQGPGGGGAGSRMNFKQRKHRRSSSNPMGPSAHAHHESAAAVNANANANANNMGVNMSASIGLAAMHSMGSMHAMPPSINQLQHQRHQSLRQNPLRMQAQQQQPQPQAQAQAQPQQMDRIANPQQSQQQYRTESAKSIVSQIEAAGDGGVPETQEDVFVLSQPQPSAQAQGQGQNAIQFPPFDMLKAAAQHNGSFQTPHGIAQQQSQPQPQSVNHQAQPRGRPHNNLMNADQNNKNDARSRSRDSRQRSNKKKKRNQKRYSDMSFAYKNKSNHNANAVPGFGGQQGQAQNQNGSQMRFGNNNNINEDIPNRLSRARSISEPDIRDLPLPAEQQQQQQQQRMRIQFGDGGGNNNPQQQAQQQQMMPYQQQSSFRNQFNLGANQQQQQQQQQRQQRKQNARMQSQPPRQIVAQQQQMQQRIEMEQQMQQQMQQQQQQQQHSQRRHSNNSVIEDPNISAFVVPEMNVHLNMNLNSNFSGLGSEDSDMNVVRGMPGFTDITHGNSHIQASNEAHVNVNADEQEKYMYGHDSAHPSSYDYKKGGAFHD